MEVADSCTRGTNRPRLPRMDGGASGRRAFSAKTRKVLGRWGPLGHLTHGRGSVLFVDGRREGALSLAGGAVTATLLWSFLLTQGPDQHGRGLHRSPALALLWPSELDDTQGLFSDFQTIADREEPCEQASMCGGGGWGETTEQREVERGRGVLLSNPGRRFREVTGPFLPVPPREAF